MKIRIAIILMALWAIGLAYLITCCNHSCKDPELALGWPIKLNQFKSVVEWKTDPNYRQFRVITRCGHTYYLNIDNEGSLLAQQEHP